MTQPKNPGPAACVPALDTLAQRPKPVAATVFENATCSDQSKLQQFAYQADLRSPADCYHSEAYLIGWLVKLYGWRVSEPGTLRRRWNAREAAAAAATAPAGAGREVA